MPIIVFKDSDNYCSYVAVDFAPWGTGLGTSKIICLHSQGVRFSWLQPNTVVVDDAIHAMYRSQLTYMENNAADFQV